MRTLSSKKITIANPYDENDIMKMKEFEENNKLEPYVSNYLIEERNNKKKELYDQELRNANETDQIVYVENKNKVMDYCYLHIEKDIKSCYISFCPTIEPNERLKLLEMTTDYAFSILGMEEIFIQISVKDKKTMEHLIVCGYENLGEENGEMSFMRENEIRKETELKM